MVADELCDLAPLAGSGRSGWFDVAALMIFLTARGRLFNYPKP